MAKRGAAGKYKPQTLAVAEEFIKTNGLMLYGGAALGDYCATLGVGYRTHYNWLERFPEYVAMIERCQEYWRQKSVKNLVNALMDSALGGFRENVVEDVEYKPNPTNPDKPMIARKRTHKEKKFYKGDTGAACYLLNNLAPDQFQNRFRNDVNVKEAQIKELSVEEAQKLIKSLEEGC